MAKRSEGNVQHARAAQRAASAEEILAKKPRTALFLVVLDDDLCIEHDRRLDELNQARTNGHTPEQVAELEAAVREAKHAIDDATVSMKLSAIGREAYDALVDAHPPTDEEIEDAKERGKPKPVYNADTFPIALIAASLVEPRMTEEQVAAIYAAWNTQEVADLFMTAMDVNSRARRLVELGKGSG